MKPLPLLLAAIGSCLAAAIALLLIRYFQVGDDPMALIVGATVGTQVGVVAHSRHPAAAATRSAKAALGTVLAAAGLILGLLVQLFFGGFEHPEITIPLSVVGSFLFPFAVFGTMWKALHKPADPAT